MRWIQRFIAPSLILVLAAGCGGPTLLKPKGRLVKGGEPYVPEDGEIVHVSFVATGEGPSGATGSYPAEVDREDGTFQVLGADGRGLPPGKYRVTVQVMKQKKDIFKGAFGVTNSPFVHEVATGSEDFTLDLSTTAAKPAPGSAAEAGRGGAPVRGRRGR